MTFESKFESLKFESKFKSLERDKKIGFICLINNLNYFLDFCHSRKLSKNGVFHCLSIIQLYLCSLKKSNKESNTGMTPDDILRGILLKNKKCKISVEQLTRLFDYINTKLPPGENFFVEDDLKEVCGILDIKPI